jgi:hypothetical protein
MTKFSLFVATIVLLFPCAFAIAEPSQIATTHSTVETVPYDTVNIPNDEDINNTSPLTDIDPMTDDESLIINDHLKAVPKTDHDENAEYHYTIDVTYPQIMGDSLSQEAQQFNQVITSMVNDQVNQFKNIVKLDAVHMNTLPEELRNNTFKIDYDIDVIKPDTQLSVVSVRLSIEGMQAGRAHPFHAHQVLNFDLTHGKALVLNDLFKKNAAYLQAIAKYSNNKLNQTLNDKWLIADGTKADLKNYKNWNLEADSILITFDEYQVAPYVDGPQEVEIPLAELKKWFAADAPVMAEFKSPSLSHMPKELAKTKNKPVEKVADAKKSNKKIAPKTIG